MKYPMLELYGIRYAKNDRDSVSSLFVCGGTATRKYKKRGKGYLLIDEQNNVRAYLATERYSNGQIKIAWCVTAYKNENGMIVFLYGCTHETKEWLKEPSSYMESREGATNAVEAFESLSKQ